MAKRIWDVETGRSREVDDLTAKVMLVSDQYTAEDPNPGATMPDTAPLEAPLEAPPEVPPTVDAPLPNET